MSDSIKHIIAWVIILSIFAGILASQEGNIVNAVNDTSVNITIEEAENTTDTTSGTETPEIIESTLEIGSSLTEAKAETDELFYIYANYTSSGEMIEGTCILDKGIDEYMMAFDPGAYFVQASYSDSGNYTYSITCNKTGYETKGANSIIEIIDAGSVIPIDNSTNTTINDTTNSTNPIIDLDNDTYPADVDCDDSNPEINPGKEEVLYNEIDDDCDPGTLDYLPFSITTEKQVYSPGQNVRIDVDATDGSDTYITINTPTNISYVYIFANQSYPVVQEFSLTSMSGTYTIEGINYYGDYTNSKEASFDVDDTFDAVITADKLTAFPGEQIHFKAQFTGAVGNVNMIWNMDDNTEKYVQEFDHSYSGPGEYNVVLTATDQGGNQIIRVKKVTVLTQYYLKVKVIDNETNSILDDAKVKLDSDTEDVNSSGMAEFKVTDKEYDLRASADGYYSYDEEIDINKSLLFTIKLVKRQESIPPVITLVSPSNNTKTSAPEFRFRFTDNEKAKCSLYISEEDGWWQEKNSSSDLSSGTEYSYKLELEPGEYYWKIGCTDEDDNSAYSKDMRIIIEEADIEALSSPDKTFNVIQNIYDVIPDFETYSPDEKRIVSYLELDVIIKDSKRKLEMANRDLYNLNKQPDTQSVITERDAIYERIDKIKADTPVSLSVLDKASFVKYVDDETFGTLFEEYLGLKKTELTNRQKEKLLEQNRLLQKKATIETTAYNVEVSYISGNSEIITLISKKLDLATTGSGIKYVEFIPKEIIQSYDDMVFIDSPESVLNKDPVFEYDAKDMTEIVYYVKEDLDLDEIPKIRSVLMTLEDDGSASPGITGFAVFQNLGFSESNAKLFMIEMIVLFILLGIYLFYYFRNSNTVIAALPMFSFAKAKKYSDNNMAANASLHGVMRHRPSNMPHRENPNYPAARYVPAKDNRYQDYVPDSTLGDPHKIGYIKAVIRQADSLLMQKRLKDAALKYYEIKFLYGLLGEEDRLAVFDEVMTLSDELTSMHVNALVDKGIIELAKGNASEAADIYSHIEEEFEKLSVEYQEKVYARCCEFALHLK